MAKNFEIVNGVYKGPRHYPGSLDLEGTSVTDLGSLKSVGGSLNLYGTSVTDLGSLKSVGGRLDLAGTAVADLGSLKSVGDWLYLRGTAVSDLGSLESVGVSIYTDDSKHYSFQDLKDLVQNIEDSSIVILVERLHVEEDPFLKRVVERRLQGGC